MLSLSIKDLVQKRDEIQHELDVLASSLISENLEGRRLYGMLQVWNNLIKEAEEKESCHQE